MHYATHLCVGMLPSRLLIVVCAYIIIKEGSAASGETKENVELSINKWKELGVDFKDLALVLTD